MNNYHFKSSTGEIKQSNNLEALRKLAHQEPTNYVRIYRHDGFMINAWGAKKYNKWRKKENERIAIFNEVSIFLK